MAAFEGMMSAGVEGSCSSTQLAPVLRLPSGHRHRLPDARRADQARLEREIRAASQNPIVHALLTAADATLLVLNAERQIVAFSSRVEGLREPAEFLGLRPGEALGCINACSASGCGTTPACETCGALGAILVSQDEDRPIEADCVMQTRAGATLDLAVRAAPVLLEGTRFTALALRDISSEKRRLELEQIFFHDVLNTVTGLRGWAEILRAAQGAHPAAAERIELLSHHIEREIRDHRALVLAERGALVPHPETLRSSSALRDLESVFATHAVARDRRLEVEAWEDLELEVDRSLLLRVLVNMVRNAFEATDPGGVVRVRCQRAPAHAGGPGSGERARFAVWNAGAMPPGVQARLFQRSFSTKSRHGRGLGTYSMKLLGEHYLGGEVSFASTEQAGTTFTFEVPRRCASGLAPTPPDPSPTAARARAQPPRRRARILVVEDDPDVRQSLVEYLADRLGHEVIAAEDGEAALAKAREWNPELVLCDLALPLLDGYSFARRARTTPSFGDTTLVAMTGSASEADRARACTSGFDRHLPKPLDLEALDRLLAELTAARA